MNKGKLPWTGQAENQDRDALKKVIRAMGLKVTSQRLLMFECFQAGQRHISAQELFEVVKKQDSAIGFATVYRFLKDLAKFNYVTELRMAGAPAKYELASHHHHDHLTCMNCGKICEFENHEIESLQERVAAQFGFLLKSHTLELYGICRDCQLKLEKDKK
jgi:Fur family ferric uptake transcriptional regulator